MRFTLIAPIPGQLSKSSFVAVAICLKEPKLLASVVTSVLFTERIDNKATENMAAVSAGSIFSLIESAVVFSYTLKVSK